MRVAIIKDYPPNIDLIRAKFPLSGREIFAWAPVIYNPSGGQLGPELIAHEQVHFVQQRDFGGPEAWWDRYLVDKEWRYEQELEAHRVEYRVFCEGKPRQQRRAFLKQLAKRLSSPMYGGVATLKKARKDIKSHE